MLPKTPFDHHEFGKQIGRHPGRAQREVDAVQGSQWPVTGIPPNRVSDQSANQDMLLTAGDQCRILVT
jgi:hypothetical protein